MIVHLEPKSPVEELLGVSIGVHVRSATFTKMSGKMYNQKLELILDADLHPSALFILHDMVIMRKTHAFEFIGIEALVCESTDKTSSKDYETVIKATFINRK